MISFTANDAEFYGVSPDQDNSEALQLALTRTGSDGIELILPPYEMRISKPLVYPYDRVLIRGHGRKSKIRCTKPGFTALTIGTGERVNENGNHISSYITDLYIEGYSIAPGDKSAGLRLDNIRFTKVEGVECNGFNFGFDLIRNCFGTSFKDIRTHFGDNRVGLLFRGWKNGVWGSGSDIPIFNGWLGGSEAAIWVNPGGGGYNLFGGQLSAGYRHTADREDLGCIVIGKDYETGEIGGSGIVSLQGMDVEGWKRTYAIRGYGRCQFKAESISFIATDKTSPALGVMKVTDGENGVWNFENCALKGTYSKDKLVDVNTNGSAFTFEERGTLPDYNLYSAGVQVKAGVTMAQQSEIANSVYTGVQEGKPYLGLGKAQMRFSGSEFQVSQDFGKTFVPVKGL